MGKVGAIGMQAGIRCGRMPAAAVADVCLSMEQRQRSRPARGIHFTAPLPLLLTCTPKFSRAAGVRQRWPTAFTALLLLQEMSRRVRLPDATIALQEWGSGWQAWAGEWKVQRQLLPCCACCARHGPHQSAAHTANAPSRKQAWCSRRQAGRQAVADNKGTLLRSHLLELTKK